MAFDLKLQARGTDDPGALKEPRSTGLDAALRARRDEAIVLGVALLAHGLLVLNTGIYWDDWLLYTQLRHGNWDQVRGMADQLGGVPTYLYIWIAAASIPPPAVGFKILALLLIAASGLLILAICRQSGLVSRTDALLIACLGVAYPADHTHVLLITVPYLVYWVAFLIGVLVLLRSELIGGPGRWLLRVLALLCFVFSFGLNSLLLFYFGALLIGVVILNRRQGIPPRRIITHELPRRLDLIIAPLAFWFVYRTWFPPNGTYGYYHQFDWTWDSISSSAAGFWQAGLAAQFRDSISALLFLPVVWLAFLVAAHWMWPRRLPAGSMGARAAMLALGLLLVVLAAFPYIAVGLSPSEHGWSSRHTILLGVPVALVIVGAARLLFGTRDGRFGVVGGAVVLSLLGGFIIDTAEGYLGWQARWITDSSVMANLASAPGAGGYSVYWVDDRYQLGGEPQYRFYEWSSMLGQAFGGQTRIGLDTATVQPSFLDTGKPFFNASYNLSGFDPAGCEARVSITRGPRAGSELGLVARYYFYGLVEPSKFNRWLAGVTTIKVVSYPASQATDCSSGSEP